MAVDGGGGAQIRAMQHGGPEERVEVDDIFADKVIYLGIRAFVPVAVEVDTFAVTQVLEAGQKANWRIQPDIKVFARGIGNFEAEVGRIPGNIPLVKARLKPLHQLIADLRLHMAVVNPALQEVGKVRQFKEVVGRCTYFGRCA